MTMSARVARLFTIKTRFEAFLVIYAIAAGAAERGLHYMAMMPGWPGMLLAFACTGVVFVAGAKLLDAVRAEQAAKPVPSAQPAMVKPRRRRRAFSRNRPRSRPTRRDSALRFSLHTD